MDIIKLKAQGEILAKEHLEDEPEMTQELNDLYKDFYVSVHVYRELASNKDLRSWEWQIIADEAYVAYKKALYKYDGLTNNSNAIH